MSVIISKNNWEEYFRPFARKYYNYAMGSPDINKATYTQLSELTGINGITEACARTIMKKQNKCKFSNIEDCLNRTKILRIFFEPFFSDD